MLLCTGNRLYDYRTSHRKKIEHALVFYLFATPGHDQWGSSDIEFKLGQTRHYCDSH